MVSSAGSGRPTPEHIHQTLNAHQQTAALKAAIEPKTGVATNLNAGRIEGG